MTSGFISRKIELIQTLGEKLEKHRKAKGLSLEKAARKLNINAHYIKILESDDFKMMPADVYTMNILKKYAALLDLNPATVVDVYLKEKEIFEKTRLRRETRNQRFYNKIADAILNPRVLQLSAIILIIVVVISYLGWEVNKIISAPALLVISPQDNFVTDNSQVQLVGETEKEVKLLINNRPLLSDRAGKFSLTLDLQKGLNIIKISAQKKYSKEQVIYRKVIVN